MDKVLALMEDVGRYLTLLKITDFLDVAIIFFLVYKLLSLVKSTRAENILKGIGIFLLALLAARALDLRAVYYVLRSVAEMGILALIILFQPEIRQILEKLGSKNIRLMRVFRPENEITELEKAIDQTVMACSEMSRTKTGVLMVFERNINLDDIVRTGTELDCAVVCELLKNIFFVKAPMHDGAVIVRHGRIIGGDAVVVIVSEETGSISVAIGGMLKRHLMPETLGKLLRNELMPPEEEPDKPKPLPVLSFLKRLGKEDDDGEEE